MELIVHKKKPTTILHILELKAVFMPKDERQILNGFPGAYASTYHCSTHHLISDVLLQGRLHLAINFTSAAAVRLFYS